MKKGDYIKWGGIIGAAIAVLEYIILAILKPSSSNANNFFIKLIIFPLNLCTWLVEIIFPSAFEGEMSGLGVLVIFPIFMVLLGLLVGFIVSLFKSKK
jgi:hypothetical protein